MKRFHITIIFLIGMLILSACNSPAPAPTAAPTPAPTDQPIETPAPQPSQAQASPTAPGEKPVSNNGIELTIPAGLGSGANAEIVGEVPDSASGPGILPEPAYSKFALQGYPVTGSRLEPDVLVYPAQAYALVNASAADSIVKLNAIIAAPSAPLTDKAMPRVYHAEGVAMWSNMKAFAFPGVSGVRMLVATAEQVVVPVTQKSLYYRFYGLTTDGKYLIIVNLPVTAPFLQPDNSSAAPSDGVAFPGQSAQAPDFDAYYKKVADLLNAAETANTLSPSMSLMDAFVQSLKLNTAGIVLPTPQPTLTTQPTLTGQPGQTPTATPTINVSQLPARPSGLTYAYDCSSGDLQITLRWTDVANNEDGYRVYRDHVMLEELPVGASVYVDTVPRGAGSYLYSVVAFNFIGESYPVTILAKTPYCQ
ncbi:MAG: hypothetical protein WA821_02510 [Anaerolineales bacterium]